MLLNPPLIPHNLPLIDYINCGILGQINNQGFNNQLLPSDCQIGKHILRHCQHRQQQFFFLQRFELTKGRVFHLDDVGLRLQHFFLVNLGPFLKQWWSFSAVFDLHLHNKLVLLFHPGNLWMLVPGE